MHYHSVSLLSLVLLKMSSAARNVRHDTEQVCNRGHLDECAFLWALEVRS